MSPADLFRYLAGNRASIERIAASRWAWLIGAILVLTAGIARNYDHLYLLKEVEWFTGPFGASLFSTVFIYWWINAVVRQNRHGNRAKQQLTFLTLFWLTSPCAWLYAIPVESWTDLLTATKWNVTFLAVVSIWRVALITRAVSVLTGVYWLRCLGAVLAPAALEMMVGSYFKSLSLVGIMGGVRLPPHTAFLVDASDFTATASLWIFLFVLIATPFVKSGQRAEQPLLRPAIALESSVWKCALLLLSAWVLVVIPMQMKTRNLYRFRELIEQQRFDEVARLASGLTRNDFPRSQFIPPDPYKRSSNDHPLFLQAPKDTPPWLRLEWEQNARIEAEERGKRR